ncbi:conserved Plasmodium protein, unknown function [Plasmodium relictum]|uniref:Uncharacterized protein n=1 Tax=Plasmodium relictum TaxID=85471 RepID=A0A1J1HC47_PLARL|nr:conserved Plasmodium protein, unknown function [Plasmodium relictum]CRH02670.1 conserved Plasmodium protein, unknown function [Plasmodium relictum]
MLNSLLDTRKCLNSILFALKLRNINKWISEGNLINNICKRNFGVSGSYGYSIFAKEGNNDSNVGKNNLHQYEEKYIVNNLIRKKNFYFTKWPGQVSKLGASYFFNKNYNMGFYHMLIEEENKIKKDIVLISSCNEKSLQNKKIDNKMKDLTCGYSVQIVLSGKGVKCYYEDVNYTPFTVQYRNNIKQYYNFKNPLKEVQMLKDRSDENIDENKNTKENKTSGENKDKNYKTKKVKKLFVRLGIGTKNIDITRILTMHKKYVNIHVDKTGTIINVYGYNKKYVGSVSHRLYKIVKMNVYTMKGGYVFLHKPKQKIPKKK